MHSGDFFQVDLESTTPTFVKCPPWCTLNELLNLLLLASVMRVFEWKHLHLKLID